MNGSVLATAEPSARSGAALQKRLSQRPFPGWAGGRSPPPCAHWGSLSPGEHCRTWWDPITGYSLCRGLCIALRRTGDWTLQRSPEAGKNLRCPTFPGSPAKQQLRTRRKHRGPVRDTMGQEQAHLSGTHSSKARKNILVRSASGNGRPTRDAAHSIKSEGPPSFLSGN